MRIFSMECLKMCVLVGLTLTAAPGRPADAASPGVGAYVYQQHKRSPADSNVDFTSALATNFGSLSPSATLQDFSYGSGFPSTAAGFGFDDVPSGLLHLSHPYAGTTFGSGFDSIGYPFADSTLNQLQFKSTLGSSPSLPVDIKYNPKGSNANLHQSRFYGLPTTELVKPTVQKAVPLQQTGSNEQRVPVESFNSAPGSLAPPQQSNPAATSFVPQNQLYTVTIAVPLQQSYPATVSAPQQQSYVPAISAPIQQSYPVPVSVQQQQSYPAAESAQQQRQQQSYSSAIAVPLQQSFSAIASAPQQQSYPAFAPVQQQQSHPAAESVPQRQSYPTSTFIPKQQSYSSAIAVPLQQSFSAIASAPQQQSYPVFASVQQQKSYPATAEDFRISSYQQPSASGTAGPPNTSNAGSVPDLALELRPPPYTAPASSVDYRQNANIQSPPASSYPPADSNKNNNNYPVNDFGLSSAPSAGTSGQTQVYSTSNSGPLTGNTNDFLAAGSNAKPDQTYTNVYYTAPAPVSGGSNSVSSNVPNYYSVPSISYSLTSIANGEFASSTNTPSASPIPSIGTDRGVPAANPTGGPNPSYIDNNSIPSVTYTNSNSISANSYSDSKSIQSSSYTTPGTPPIAANSYSNYKFSTDNFFGDTNSISLNSKRESSTVNSSYKPPLRI